MACITEDRITAALLTTTADAVIETVRARAVAAGVIANDAPFDAEEARAAVAEAGPGLEALVRLIVCCGAQVPLPDAVANAAARAA